MSDDANLSKDQGRRSRLMRFLPPVVIVLAGALIMHGFVASRKKPPRGQIRQVGALVEVLPAEAADRRVTLEGTGTVAPRYEVTLIPQVSGKVSWVHPELVAGGEFREGDELLRIEQEDYVLAVERATAQVAQSELQIEVARANAAIARREWELMNASRSRLLGDSAVVSSDPDPLVLHKPQLRQAEAALAASRAALETAELSLSRTILRAPFNCRVRAQSVAPGQLVGPNSPVAVLYGTDLVEVEVGLPVADLGWIDVPGAEAKIILDTGGQVHTWRGRVDRTVGVLDEIGRLARVVVRVEDPFRRQDLRGPELSIGSFVVAEITGRMVPGTVPIPRGALREDSTVWIVAPDSTLEIRQVSIHRLTPQEALIAAGVAPGERIVLTSLSGAAPGMRLRPVEIRR
jgi:RND family efflux transporter MFP subunit